METRAQRHQKDFKCGTTKHWKLMKQILFSINFQDLKNSYILDHTVPEIFAVSTDKPQGDEESMNSAKEDSKLL